MNGLGFLIVRLLLLPVAWLVEEGRAFVTRWRK